MTNAAPFFPHVPWFWEGALVPLTQAHWFVHVASLLVRSFGAAADIDDEDRRLVNALVAVNAPRGDRVSLRFRRGETVLSFAEALRWLRTQEADVSREGLARWCSAIELDHERSFDLVPAEFHARCLPHYQGFLHAWTDQHHARRNYPTWPLRRQAEFAHEYLLYAANDARSAQQHGGAADDGLQRAAAWLVSRRRFIVQWTLVLSDEPLPKPAAPSEEQFLTALQQLIALESRDEAWASRFLKEVNDSLYAPAATFSELERLLQRLDCDQGRLRSLRFWENARALERVTFDAGSEAERLQQDALRWCELAQRWAW